MPYIPIWFPTPTGIITKGRVKSDSEHCWIWLRNKIETKPKIKYILKKNNIGTCLLTGSSVQNL